MALAATYEEAMVPGGSELALTGQLDSPIAEEERDDEMVPPKDEMHTFVQRCLLNLLQPLTFQVRDLEKQLHAMRDEYLDNVVRLDKKLARHEGYGKRFEELEAENAKLLETWNKNAKQREKDSASICKMGQQVEHLQKLQGALEQRLSESASALQGLQSFCAETYVRADRFEGFAAESSGSSTELRSSLSHLERENERLRHLQAGLSERLEVVKCKGDEHQQALDDLAPTVQHLVEKLRKSQATTDQRFDALQPKFDACHEKMKQQDDNHAALREDVDQLFEGLGIIRSKTDGLHEHIQQNKAEAESSMDKILDVKTRVGGLIERMDVMEAGVKTGQAEREGMGLQLQALKSEVGKQDDKIVAQAGRMDSLETSQNKQAQSLDELSMRMSCAERQQEQLKAKTGKIDEDLHVLTKEHGDLSLKVAADKKSIETMYTRQHVQENWLQDVNARVKALILDLESSKEVVAKTVPRLELAHEYLQGLTKGLQDAHSRVASGQDGMLRVKQGCGAMTLPELPGSRRATPSPGSVLRES
eukprot:TRINITY_DN29940_c0_g1_i1.p1 TRINITY_DN29940_c0_g1~~TRINITY_DN29940_c0_g1_i1.p1  ORF type:complete len:574 (-),score=193.67 TRINITY_DN29940_c0_g1_i1:180-1781(-)